VAPIYMYCLPPAGGRFALQVDEFARGREGMGECGNEFARGGRVREEKMGISS